MRAAPWAGAKPGARLQGFQARLLAAHIPPLAYALLLCAAMGLRLFIAASQRLYLIPEGSAIDDMLMVRAAQSLVQGGWLGAYGGMAIAKNMGFALWLAVLHQLGIPLLLANAALWLACCSVAVRALRPVLAGNVGRLAFFCFLAFQPVSYAQFNQRAYRDAIFPAFCLLVFAGVVGLALRLPQGRLRGSVLCALAAGVGLAGCWLLREDGAVLLVFAACALLVVALYALFSKKTLRRWAKLCMAVVPLLALGAGILGFSAANSAYYGVFMVNDFTAGAFPQAYGAMVAVSRAESGSTGKTPVSRAALQKLFNEVPSLSDISGHLVEGPAFNGFADKQTGEFGGSFYYGLRLAAGYAGKTPSAPAAQAYWRQVADEIAQAVAEGRLQSETPSALVLPRWDMSLLGPTAAETGRGFLHVMCFAECDAAALLSVGRGDYAVQTAEFLHGAIQYSNDAENVTQGQPAYGFTQKAAFALCSAITWVYRIAIWPLFGLAVWRMLGLLGAGARALFVQKRAGTPLLAGILLLGLLLSFVLRLAVAAYMEVASFGVGTYIMYLSGGVPALLLFCALGAALPAAKSRATAAAAAEENAIEQAG